MESMFTCSCEDYDDTCMFYSARDVIAKIQHECCECKRLIEPGEKYEYVSGKWEDEFNTFKTCLLCAQIRDELFVCGFCHGTLWARIHSEYCIASLPEDDYCICPPRNPRNTPKSFPNASSAAPKARCQKEEPQTLSGV